MVELLLMIYYRVTTLLNQEINWLLKHLKKLA